MSLVIRLQGFCERQKAHDATNMKNPIRNTEKKERLPVVSSCLATPARARGISCGCRERSDRHELFVAWRLALLQEPQLSRSQI
jgi:hypothetical protein